MGQGRPIHLGPLERASLNHWTRRTETDPVSETLCFYRFYSFEHWTMDRVHKPNNHVQHTPSSESFQAYQDIYILLISFYENFILCNSEGEETRHDVDMFVSH
jgi:hypothetical protein